MITNLESENMSVKYFLNLDYKNDKLRRKVFYTINTSYIIVNYDKRYLCFDDVENFLYRSVIFSMINNEIVCFTPPKSLTQQYFMKKYPNIIPFNNGNNEMYIN